MSNREAPAASGDERTQFDYLLNAVMRAGQADKPAEHGYGVKRAELFAYVRDLERRAASAPQAVRMLTEQECHELAETVGLGSVTVQRKFCEVNGLGIVPPAKEGT